MNVVRFWNGDGRRQGFDSTDGAFDTDGPRVRRDAADEEMGRWSAGGEKSAGGMKIRRDVR